MRLVGKKHHLVAVRRNIRLSITYYHPTYSFSPGVMRLGNAKRHLPTVKRNIRLTITYCRPMSSISPSMMRLIDKKCHLAIARGNIWPAITYCLSMFSPSYFLMRLLESNNINVECRQLLLFPTSYLWRVDGSASVFSSQPHPSLSLFIFTFHFFFVIIHHHLSITYISHQVNLLVKIFIEYLLLWNVVFYGWGYPPEL